MIPGFYYLPNFISEPLQVSLNSFLNDPSRSWRNIGDSNISRKFMILGSSYEGESPVEPFPDVMTQVRDMIRELVVVPDLVPLNQCLITRYDPPQGRSASRTSDIYGEFLCCVTLGSGVELEFKKGMEIVKMYVEPNSLYILSGEVRDEWLLQIRAKMEDKVYYQIIPRTIRTALTFRSVE